MIPVPFFQVLDFVDWLKRKQIVLKRETLNSGYIYEMALKYLHEGGGKGGSNKYNLYYLMQIFQTCPMISESTIEDQMRHFAQCGRCLTYLREKRLQPYSVELHPLLVGFLQFAQNNFDDRFPTIPSRDFPNIENEEVIFSRVIDEIGSDLLERFIFYIRTQASQSLVDDYLINRERLSSISRPTILSNNNQTHQNGTEPLWTYRNVSEEARRLSNSVQLLLEGSFYKDQMLQQPEVYELLRAAGFISKETIQSVEFLSWLQEKHPQLDILASMPIHQIQELAIEFCEQNNYKNASSFSKETAKWISGQGERSIIQRIIEIGERIKRRNKTYRSSVSPFKRYQTIPYHAVYLFLAAGDFPKYIQTYWEDLNCLTGDYIDVYYSFEDVEHKVSAFDTINEFRSLSVEATELPALLIWKQNLSDRCIIPLANLPHPDIFDVTKLIVQRIADGKDLGEIESDALELVGEKTDALSPAPRYTIKGDMNMNKNEIKIGDSNTINGNVVAAYSIDHSFNQVEAAKITDELKDSLKQLATAVKKMSESLSKDEAELVARDYKTLVDEATSKTPREAWWKLSVDGLKKAAENIGAIGIPVIELATKIAKLLVGIA